MKLYVHNGLGKTGSSAIQAFMDHNRRALLERHRILYPNTEGGPVDRGVCPTHSHLFVSLSPREGFRRLAKSIRWALRHDVAAVVISSEGRTPLWTQLVRDVDKRFDIETRIILYMRRQDHLVEAAWKQWGMKRGSRTFEEYLERELDIVQQEGPSPPGRLFSYEAILDRWNTFIPRERIVAWPYERSQLTDGDVVTDFLGRIGINDRGGLEDPPASQFNRNFGFQPAVLELMRLGYGLADEAIDRYAQSFLYDALGDNQSKRPFETYSLISPAQRRRVLELCDPMNRRIARAYLGREDERLFHEPWPRGDEPWEPIRVDAEQLMPLLFRLMAHLVTRRHEMELQAGRLHRKLTGWRRASAASA